MEEGSVILQTKLLQTCEAFRTKNFWISLSLGQLCSLFLCGTAVTSTFLAQKDVNCPTSQSFFNYVMLGVIYGVVFTCSSSKRDDLVWIALRERWWKYLLLAVVDVEANYFLVKAYQFTTLTSVQLLDCMTIPVVLLLSRFLLKYRFRWIHYIAVLICIAGAASMVLGDFFTKKTAEEGRSRLLGDFMVIGGSVMYAISNVSEEYIVKRHSRMEFLMMLGLGGTVVSGIQVAVLERHALSQMDWSDLSIIFHLVLFAFCLFGLYSIVPVLMRRNGATVFNLSILSADFYALLLGLFLLQYEFHYMYFVGFVLVVGGLITYASRCPDSDFEAVPAQDILVSKEVASSLPSNGDGIDLRSHRILFVPD